MQRFLNQILQVLFPIFYAVICILCSVSKSKSRNSYLLKLRIQKSHALLHAANFSMVFLLLSSILAHYVVKICLVFVTIS